jgi:prepilin-type N-terminal cleavage/methylation domain-containing protein/prepilin-type processing-associated H-X9-DG protein
MRRNKHGFTLIELLVVVAIIALLIAILLPSLGKARQRSQATRCLANLHSIGQGLVVYQTQNDGLVVPSYNMSGFDITHMAYGGSNPAPNNVIDGWATILDRDGAVPTSGGLTNNVFYCPSTLDDAGMNDSPYYDDSSPLGYFDWPAQFKGPGGDKPPVSDPSSPLPIANFGDANGPYLHEIRCSYWLNANNPTGTAVPTGSAPAPLYYTQSVGCVYSDGTVLNAVRSGAFVRPMALIVATDGVYSGRQSKGFKGTHVADTSAAFRIGYRHTGQGGVNTATNVVFADGHAEPVNTPPASVIALPATTSAPGNYMPKSANVGDNTGPFSFLVTQ